MVVGINITSRCYVLGIATPTTGWRARVSNTDGGQGILYSTDPSRTPWDPPNLLYWGYLGSFLGVKRPEWLLLVAPPFLLLLLHVPALLDHHQVINLRECFFFNPMPHMSFTDFVVLPPGHGRSVTDFSGWDAHEARLRCPDDVSGDIGGCSARRALKPKFY